MTTEPLKDALFSLRKQARMSQDKLAKTAGVARGTIKGIESGETQPQPDTLRKIADGLATDGVGLRDWMRADENYARLMAAAGYLPSEQAAARISIGIRAELAKIFPPERAPLVAKIIEDLATRTDRRQREIMGGLRTMTDMPEETGQ